MGQAGSTANAGNANTTIPTETVNTLNAGNANTNANANAIQEAEKAAAEKAAAEKAAAEKAAAEKAAAEKAAASNSNGFYILIIFVLILLFGLGFYFATKKKELPPTVKNNPTGGYNCKNRSNNKLYLY
jgi:cobalamin biosynthesis Mg chelatase CobN